MNRALIAVAAVTCWAAALFGVLQIHHLPGDWGHGICGPWGCGPPLQALVAWHGFWIVAASLPLAFALRNWPKRQQGWIGLALFSIGLFGVIAIVGDECVRVFRDVPSGQPAYFIQSCLFRLATLVDVPLVPLILAGCILLISGCFRSDSERSKCGGQQ